MPIEGTQAERDARYMAAALELAQKGLCSTTPNPRVGCVIVANDAIVARGWHRQAGADHAEVEALKQAGAAARNATVYVTLEPCCVEGRTGPCTRALIDAGVGRVVYAMRDPNPCVDGRGSEALLAAGIEVTGGVLQREAEALNKGFCRRMRSAMPWLLAKTASSLDGRTAMASGESQWITGAAARSEVHYLRAASCALLTGVDTVLADDPEFTVREVPEGFKLARQPALIIADSDLRTPTVAKLFRVSTGVERRIIIACLASAPDESKRQLREAGAELWELEPGDDGRVDLLALLKRAAQCEFNEVMLESGATLLGHALQLGLVDELLAFVAPKVLGSDARALADLHFGRLDDTLRFELAEVKQLGNDALLRCLKTSD